MDNQIKNNLILKDLFLGVLLTNGYSDEVNKKLMEQQVETQNKLKEVEAEMDEVKDGIQANLEAAQVFNEPVASVVIPYEKDMKISDNAVKDWINNRIWQMPYCRSTVTSGQYKIWIEQLDEQQLSSFQTVCNHNLPICLQRKVTAPDWKYLERDLTRSFMYEIEMHRRRFGWDKAVKEKLFTDYQAEVTLWQARYQLKREEYFAAVGIGTTGSTEVDMPY